MEENAKVVESLLEKAAEFGKTNLELVKLKAVDKTSELLSAWLPLAIVYALLILFLVFLNLGLAFWLGDLTGKTHYGFFIVAGFYLLTGLVVRLFFFRWIKRVVSDAVIRLLLK